MFSVLRFSDLTQRTPRTAEGHRETLPHFQWEFWFCARLDLIATKTEQTVTRLLNWIDFCLYTPSRRPYS